MKAGFLVVLSIIVLLILCNVNFSEATDVSDCQNITSPGTYTLTSNVNSTGICFNISTSDVILDCQGYLVNYSNAVSTTTIIGGIYAKSVDNITIMGCNISETYKVPSDHRNGIFFDGVNDSLIYNNTFYTKTGQSSCVQLNDTKNINVSSNTMYGGIQTYDIGVYVLYSNNTIVENNNINTRCTDGYGIGIYDSDYLTASGNHFITNGDDAWGIFFYNYSIGNTIHDNIIENLGGDGYPLSIGYITPDTYAEFVAYDNILNLTGTAYGSGTEGLILQGFSGDGTVIGGEFNLTNATDSDYNPIGIDWQPNNNGTLNMKWYLDINATNNSLGVDTARVEIWDKDSTLVFNDTTDAAGILRVTLLEYTNINNTDITYYSNYTVNTSHADLTTQTDQVNLSVTYNTELNVEFYEAVDSIPPVSSLNQTNSTEIVSDVLHSLYWTDETELAGYIFSFDNCTGTLSNDSWVAFSGTGNWSNVTKSVNLTVGCTARWQVFANDTSDNLNASSIFTYTTTDSVSPTYSLNQTNDTTAGADILHSLYWSDLGILSGYIFSFCNGTWNGTDCGTSNETVYGSYNDTTGAYENTYGATTFKGQKFKVGVGGEDSNFNITAVDIMALKIGSVDGYVNVSIRDINESSGLPIGSDLSKGAILASSISDTEQFNRVEMSAYELNASTNYSIVINYPLGNATDYVRFYLNTAWGYAGYWMLSTDGGSGWSKIAGENMPFNVYGNSTSSNGWTNDTWASFSGTGNWSNITKSVNTTTGANISWFVWANDTSNNINQSEIFTYDTIAPPDTTPPIITVVWPQNTTYSSTTQTFNITTNEACDTGIYSLDGGTTNVTMVNVSSTEFMDGAILSEGSYTVTFWVNDTSGNLNTTSIGFTIDPVIDYKNDCYTFLADNEYIALNTSFSTTAAQCFQCTDLKNITIDCDGYTVTATGSDQEFFRNNGCSNITLKNCVVTGNFIYALRSRTNSVTYPDRIFYVYDSTITTTGSGDMFLYAYGNGFNNTVYTRNATITSEYIYQIESVATCNITSHHYNTTTSGTLFKRQTGSATIFFNHDDWQWFNLTTFNYSTGAALGTVDINFTDTLGMNSTSTATDASGEWVGWLEDGYVDYTGTGTTTASATTLNPYSINATKGNYTNSTTFSVSRDGQFTVYLEEIDMSPPNMTLLTPLNTTLYDASVWFNITLDGPADTCFVDYGSGNKTLSNSSGSWNHNNASVPDGTYNTKYWCNNSYGNAVTNTTVYFTVDAPPVINIYSCAEGFTIPKANTFYSIQNDLQLTSSTNNICISTSLSNITIDCNGNSIYYAGSVSGEPTIIKLLESSDNVTIQNCKELAYFQHLYLTGTPDVAHMNAINVSNYTGVENPGTSSPYDLFENVGGDAGKIYYLNYTNVIINNGTDTSGSTLFITDGGNITAHYDNVTYSNGIDYLYYKYNSGTYSNFSFYRLWDMNITVLNSTDAISGANITIHDSGMYVNDSGTSDVSGFVEFTLAQFFVNDYRSTGTTVAIGETGTSLNSQTVSASYIGYETNTTQFNISGIGSFIVYIFPDTTAPSLTISSPTGTYTSSSIWFNLTGSETMDTCFVDYSGSNTSLTNSSGNWNYLGTLSNAAYTAKFWCNDTAGNGNMTTVSFTVSVDSGTPGDRGGSPTVPEVNETVNETSENVNNQTVTLEIPDLMSVDLIVPKELVSVVGNEPLGYALIGGTAIAELAFLMRERRKKRLNWKSYAFAGATALLAVWLIFAFAFQSPLTWETIQAHAQAVRSL